MFNSIHRMRSDEKFLLFISFIITLIVFILINSYFTGQGLIFWALVETGIMWVIIVSLLILADNQRLLNDELKQVIREQLQEIKLLKQFANEALVLIKKKR